MKSKNIESKLSYNEISDELNNIKNILSVSFKEKKYQYAIPLLNLRENFLEKYDSYTSEEQRKMMDKFHLIDKLITDYIRTNL